EHLADGRLREEQEAPPGRHAGEPQVHRDHGGHRDHRGDRAGRPRAGRPARHGGGVHRAEPVLAAPDRAPAHAAAAHGRRRGLRRAMGVMRRIADAARTTWERRMRIGEKPLSELTDKELEAELVRRRRMRAAGRAVASGAEPSAEASGARAAVQRAKVRQWYANLELAPGATLADVKAAYERLMKR